MTESKRFSHFIEAKRILQKKYLLFLTLCIFFQFSIDKVGAQDFEQLFCEVTVDKSNPDVIPMAHWDCDAPYAEDGTLLSAEFMYMPMTEETEEEWQERLRQSEELFNTFPFKVLDKETGIQKEFNCYSYVLQLLQKKYGINFGVTEKDFISEDFMEFIADIFMNEVYAGTVKDFDQKKLKTDDVVLFYDDTGLLLHSASVNSVADQKSTDAKEKNKLPLLTGKNGNFHLFEGELLATSKYFTAPVIRVVRAKENFDIQIQLNEYFAKMFPQFYLKFLAGRKPASTKVSV